MTTFAVLNLAIPMVIAASTTESDCSRYAAMRGLPADFHEIASADLVGGAEWFNLTNGTCTCDSQPAVDRHFGKPAPSNINWVCRPATAEEREHVQQIELDR